MHSYLLPQLNQSYSMGRGRVKNGGEEGFVVEGDRVHDTGKCAKTRLIGKNEQKNNILLIKF